MRGGGHDDLNEVEMEGDEISVEGNDEGGYGGVK